MDHAINSLVPFLDAELDWLREEWNSGKYRKITKCPSYPACKAIVDAIHVLEKYYYGEHKTCTVRELLTW